MSSVMAAHPWGTDEVERRLEGIRVLVTRPRERAEALCFLLEDEGAEVLAIPFLELLPPLDGRPLAAAAEAIQRYRWVVFASPSAVEALVEALREAGTADRLRRVKIAAVGPRTARAVAAESSDGTALGLLGRLRAELAAGDDVLLPAAEEGRRELEEALLEHGARVTRVCAYRSQTAQIAGEAIGLVQKSPPDVVLFASPRTAEAFLEGAGRDLLRAARAVAIGPTTASALERLEVPVAAVALQPTPEGLLDATIRAVRG